MTSDFLPTLLANVWSILLVVVFFSASIFVHELGHFLAARWRGAKVERFSIGFGPAIWSWHGRDGVEYRISWLPLGGYVLLPQLADLGPIEGKVESDVTKLPPVSYASKMIIFVAGALFNVLFAFLLATIIWNIGRQEGKEVATTVIGHVSVQLKGSDGKFIPSPASVAGLHVGDEIKAIDGRVTNNWFDVFSQIGLGSGQSADGRRQAIFTILRDGKLQEVTVYPQLVGDERDRRVGLGPYLDLNVLEIEPKSIASKSGFHPEDLVLRVDGQPVHSNLTFDDLINASPERPITVVIRRNGRERTLTIPPRLETKTDKTGTGIGLTFDPGFTLVYPTPFAQISEQVTMSFRTLWSLINPHSDVGISKLTGPVGIASIFHSAAEAGIRPVLMFTILLNMSLAIFNLLPLPILDGGQMLFATIGRLRGRALPINFILAANSVFFVLLISMVIYVSVYDVRRINRGRSEAAPPVAPLAPAVPAPATPAPAKP